MSLVVSGRELACGFTQCDKPRHLGLDINTGFECSGPSLGDKSWAGSLTQQAWCPWRRAGYERSCERGLTNLDAATLLIKTVILDEPHTHNSYPQLSIRNSC